MSVLRNKRSKSVKKISHPYYVYNESIVGSKLLANRKHLIHDVFVEPLPQCKAKKYTWCAPPEIPLTFEEAFIQGTGFDSYFSMN